MPPRETSTADLEVSLHRWYADSYAIELRFKQPNSDVDIPPVREVKVQFDFERLRENSTDSAEYGRILSEILFSPRAIRDSFVRARAVARERGVGLNGQPAPNSSLYQSEGLGGVPVLGGERSDGER